MQKFAIAWCLLLSLGLLSLWSAMNRAQDLESLAHRVAWNAGADPLLLWNPDETTLAWAQLYLPAGSWRSLESAGAGAGAAAMAGASANASAASPPEHALVVSLAPGSWSREQWLAYLRGESATPVTAAEATVAAANEPRLSAAGFSVSARVERPGGRGYFLWRRNTGVNQ